MTTDEALTIIGKAADETMSMSRGQGGYSALVFIRKNGKPRLIRGPLEPTPPAAIVALAQKVKEAL